MGTAFVCLVVCLPVRLFPCVGHPTPLATHPNDPPNNPSNDLSLRATPAKHPYDPPKGPAQTTHPAHHYFPNRFKQVELTPRSYRLSAGVGSSIWHYFNANHVGFTAFS